MSYRTEAAAGVAAANGAYFADCERQTPAAVARDELSRNLPRRSAAWGDLAPATEIAAD